jgi:hypothetical protein
MMCATQAPDAPSMMITFSLMVQRFCRAHCELPGLWQTSCDDR